MFTGAAFSFLLDNDSDFSTNANDDCSFIPAETSCQVNVVFDPFAGGDRQGTLYVTGPAKFRCSTEQTPIPLAGTGIATSQTITFNALSNRTYGEPAFSVAATATSELAVTFSSLTLSVCT